MRRRVVIAYHLIWTAYGWWLPNDPRGSTSRTIRDDVIAELGELHQGRKWIQPDSRAIKGFYAAAAGVLDHELLEFTPEETRVIADSFATTIAREQYTCYACAIMPDHVHMLIRRHRDDAEKMIRRLQEHSRWHLQKLQMRSADHPVWGGPGWKVFMETPDAIERTIRYVEANPSKQRMKPQTWEFVRPYDGWPLYGRSPV